MSDGHELLEAARSFQDWLSEIRRDLHQYPELGLEEHRTAGKVQERLDELGIEHRDGIGETGVLGLIRGRAEGPVVALRGDMDALPITDAKDVPYKSQVEGKMHACGHDVHTTVLLGAARLLAERRDSFDGLVKLIFQPAEETVGGAQLMIAEGVLEEPTVEAIFGLHVDAGIDAGSFRIRYGQGNASSDTLSLIIKGKSGHAAYPAGSVDAIVVAAQVVSALQTVVSRNVDARRSAVVTFGTIAGGVQHNVITNRVELTGTVRALDQATRELVLERVRETVEGVAAALGGSAQLEIEPGYPPLVSDERIVDVVRDNAVILVGEDHVSVSPEPKMGVEDFAYFAREVPAAFYNLGVRNEAAGIVHHVHHELFDADEECLPYGAALQAMNALSILS